MAFWYSWLRQAQQRRPYFGRTWSLFDSALPEEPRPGGVLALLPHISLVARLSYSCLSFLCKVSSSRLPRRFTAYSPRPSQVSRRPWCRVFRLSRIGA